MKRLRHSIFLLAILFAIGACATGRSPKVAAKERGAKEGARRMAASSRGVLAPVYPALADYLVQQFRLAEKSGVGIDLGGGHGALAIELCKRTQLHWINADINPHVFVPFFEAAGKAGVGHQVSAVYADAQAMPFRDNYAESIVSRGSFFLWQDKLSAFREIYRVLKPGGVAFIGRGFSPNLPAEVARQIRDAQARRPSFPKYDVRETESELRDVLAKAGIRDYRVHIPEDPGGSGVNYGIWVEFHKRP